jgi:hypothetical protein
MVYYAPNTYKELKLAALRQVNHLVGVKPEESMTVKNIVAGQNPFYSLSEFVTVLGPYFVIRFPARLLAHVRDWSPPTATSCLHGFRSNFSMLSH